MDKMDFNAVSTFIEEQKVYLEGECTVNEINDRYHQIIAQWKDQNQGITLDLSGVTSMDSCFMDLLSIIYNTAINNDTQCQVLNIPAIAKNKVDVYPWEG